MAILLVSVFAVLAVLAVAVCNRVAPPPPIRAFAIENGKPISWNAGERSSVEGRIIKTGDGDYVLFNTVGTGEAAYESCFPLRGPDIGWSLRRLRIAMLADSGKRVAVTGYSTAAHHMPGLGHGMLRCVKTNLHVDGLTVL